MQRQYGYRQGIVLVIDPFSIPEVRFQFEELLEPEDIAGIGRADINGIINAFLTKLREVTGLSDNKMSAVPLAGKSTPPGWGSCGVSTALPRSWEIGRARIFYLRVGTKYG